MTDAQRAWMTDFPAQYDIDSLQLEFSTCALLTLSEDKRTIEEILGDYCKYCDIDMQDIIKKAENLM
jgi:hypothetical protein